MGALQMWLVVRVETAVAWPPKEEKCREQFPKVPGVSTGPNPYEAPRCQETHAPSERMCQLFFRRVGPDVVRLWQRVRT